MRSVSINLSKDFFAGLIVTAAACSIGAGFAPNPADAKREYLEACQAINGEMAANPAYGTIESKQRWAARVAHWSDVMDKYKPNP